MAGPRRRGPAYRGPIVDVHVHPMFGPVPILGSAPHTADDYLRAARRLDVRFVGALGIARARDPRGTRTMNDRLLRLARESGGRFFAVCSVHPADGRAALEEVDRVARAGAHGLKLHPNTQAFDVAAPAVTRLVRQAARLGLPVLFDAYSPFDADQPGKFIRLAIDVPDAKLILAHAHGPNFHELLAYAALNKYPWWRRNVWVDLSFTGPLLAGSPFASALRWVGRTVGVERLLFGSDYPLDDPVDAVAGLVRLGFRRDEEDRIFYRNAVELFGLDRTTALPRRAPRGRS